MYKKLKEYFPDSVSGNGIFKAISKYYWFEGITPDHVDTYFYLTAGEKSGMKFLDDFADTSGHITGTKLDSLAKVILDRNLNSWVHQYKALTVEYNPIENTDFVESFTDTTHEEGNNTSKTIGKMDMTNTSVTTGSMETDNKVAGFNSSTNVDSSSSKTDYGAETDDPVTVTNTTTTDYGTETGTPVTNKSDAESDKTFTREYRKHGNIGVTTNAQMIMSDVEVWKLNKFYDILIADICKLIALSIY